MCRVLRGGEMQPQQDMLLGLFGRVFQRGGLVALVLAGYLIVTEKSANQRVVACDGA